MPERISGSDLYVTHEKMNTYLTGIIAGGAAMVCSVIGGTWYLSSQIAEVRQDVAVVKVRIEGLSGAALKPTQDINQAQYILVQRSEAELFNATVREVLIKQGKIDGAP